MMGISIDVCRSAADVRTKTAQVQAFRARVWPPQRPTAPPPLPPSSPPLPAAALPMPAGRITVRLVLQATAAHFETTVDALLSHCRKRPLIRYRQIAMYVAHKLTGRSLPFIGQKIGGRDHTTILHGIRVVKALIAAGDRFTVTAVNQIIARLTEAPMTDAANDVDRAIEDGAIFVPSGMGEWSVKDRYGTTIAEQAMSMAEAARLYWEDWHAAMTPDAILARIKRQYRPYDAMPAFEAGFRSCQLAARTLNNPHNPDSRDAQAWDRGANAAMLYARALAHLDAHKDDVEQTGPGWLAAFIRNGGRA